MAAGYVSEDDLLYLRVHALFFYLYFVQSQPILRGVPRASRHPQVNRLVIFSKTVTSDFF